MLPMPPFSHIVAGGYPWLGACPPRARSSSQAIPAGTFIHLTHSIYEILNSHLSSCLGLMQAQRFLAATLGSAARAIPVGCTHPGTSEGPPEAPPKTGLHCTIEPGTALPRHSIFKSCLFVSRVFLKKEIKPALQNPSLTVLIKKRCPFHLQGLKLPSHFTVSYL